MRQVAVTLSPVNRMCDVVQVSFSVFAYALCMRFTLSVDSHLQSFKFYIRCFHSGFPQEL